MIFPNLRGSYFSIENPFSRLERFYNRFCHQQQIRLHGREVLVRWTDRAHRALQNRDSPLLVEVQLYFSCVVKKRVLFHERHGSSSVPIQPKLEMIFRSISSAACDPETFAAHHPEGRDLSSGPASKLPPRIVEIDFRRNHWEGSCRYT